MQNDDQGGRRSLVRSDIAKHPQIAWVGPKPNFLAELARISSAECADRKQCCADGATETAK